METKGKYIHTKGRYLDPQTGRFVNARPERIEINHQLRIEKSLLDALTKAAGTGGSKGEYVRKSLVRQLIEDGYQIPDELKEWYLDSKR